MNILHVLVFVKFIFILHPLTPLLSKTDDIFKTNQNRVLINFIGANSRGFQGILGKFQGLFKSMDPAVRVPVKFSFRQTCEHFLKSKIKHKYHYTIDKMCILP